MVRACMSACGRAGRCSKAAGRWAGSRLRPLTGCHHRLRHQVLGRVGDGGGPGAGRVGGHVPVPRLVPVQQHLQA